MSVVTKLVHLKKIDEKLQPLKFIKIYLHFHKTYGR